MADDKQPEQQTSDAGADDLEAAKPKPKQAETDESGAGYGNNAGPQGEVDEQ